MVYNYKFAAIAEKDLDGILEYVSAHLHNPTAAQKLACKVFEAIDNICHFPDAGVLLDNEYVSDNAVRRLVIDNYILYYKPVRAEKTIYIVRIVCGYRKQDDVL